MANDSGYTKADYLTGACSQDEYYGQFVTLGVINYVSSELGAERIQTCGVDLIGIKNSEWNALSFTVNRLAGDKLRASGASASLSDLVNVAKAAARVIRELGE